MHQTNPATKAVCAKRTIELLFIVAWVFLFSCGPALKEASSNFDLKDVDGFLQAVSGLVETGFGIEERNQLLRMIKSMKVDESKSIEFKVTF